MKNSMKNGMKKSKKTAKNIRKVSDYPPVPPDRPGHTAGGSKPGAVKQRRQHEKREKRLAGRSI